MNDFCSKWWLYIVVVTPTQLHLKKIQTKPSIMGTTSINGNRDDTYCLLPFSFTLKINSLFSPHLISLLTKNVTRKDTSPNYIDFSKIKQELVVFRYK